MKIIVKIIKAPISLIVLIYSLYVTYRITIETEIQDLDEIDTEEEFNEILKPFVDNFMNKYELLLNSFNVIVWLIILKLLFFYLVYTK